ncbi:hypothetical protein ACQP2F_02560 [Actinoplanes sp. CA-030573]|uniref:hypothetical protein n=1 Tax=Actinoplanes sp. CA-030573 TaxID=3239898 RepID=UPI003D8E3D69
MIYQRLHAAVTAAAAAEIHEMVASFFLADLMSGRSGLRAVWHPLGFACLPVLRDGDEGICLHVWPELREPAPRTTSPFHCHSWDLLSHVLYGTVGNQPVDITAGDRYRVFEAQSTAAGDDLVATERLVDAYGRTPELWGGGQTYSLPAGVFHASVIGDGSVAATVVLGKHHPKRPDLTLGDPAQSTHRVTRRLCSAEETSAYAEMVAARIAPFAGAAAR